MTFPCHSRSAQGPTSIWARDHRSLTIGSILAVTIIALQGIAVATMALLLASDLGGRSLYGWIFTSFILPQIVGTVLAGQEVDRRSPARVFMLHLLLLAIGCAISAAAPSIHVFFIGRALQGFGAGGVFACVYATVSTIYDDRLRPAMLATISTAFVVPSLVGPAISGLIAEQYVGIAGVLLALGERLGRGTLAGTAAALGVGLLMLTLAFVCAWRDWTARDSVGGTVS